MSLTLYELPPSPNCVAVRLAMGVKGLEYSSQMVNAQDRSSAIEAYGAPLTPGLTDGELKLYDSHAIVRYLDLNFDGPRLLPTDPDQLRAAEKWERWARVESIAPLGSVFGMAFGTQDFDSAALEQARAELTEQTRDFEQTVADCDWLVGDSVTVADLFAASRLVMVLPPQSIVDKVAAMDFPFWPFFFEHTGVQEERPATRAYLERVMRFDRLFQ